MNVRNPILSGFHPDPSIAVVGRDYYLATSTFEWYPGVLIYHSSDLTTWELVARPLDSTRLLNIRGVPDSCGVWAPCLTYDRGVYYLVYSAVRSFDGVWKDTPNYLTSATDINGPWSDPVLLSKSGFDGSIFHDVDGKTWYLSMLVDHREGKFFGGIVLQEFSKEQQTLIGDQYLIFEGTQLGKTEGPHLYQKDGYYYLLTAEGGTEYGHAVIIARSQSIQGPYELHPGNPLITSRDDPNAALQKAGHGDLFASNEGQWYVVFLVGRPIPGTDRCILGRETAIEKIEWKEGWPWPASGNRTPRLEIGTPVKVADIDIRVSFNGALSPEFQSLRRPITLDWCDMISRPGWLRLHGGDSLTSLFEQSHLARRMQHFSGEWEVVFDFEPRCFQHLSGITCYYNTGHYFYVYISGSSGYRELRLIKSDNFTTTELIEPVRVASSGHLVLTMKWTKGDLKFAYKLDSEPVWLPGVFDGSILSDDYVRDGSDRYRPAFTGCFVGFNCMDLRGDGVFADIQSARYSGVSF